MFLIGGEHGVVHFGPRANPRRYKYWAERGIIHVEDAEDNSYDTLSVREFLQRLRAVNDMIGNSKNSTTSLAAEGFAHLDELQRQQKFVEEGLELVEKAKIQGLPPRISGPVMRMPVPVCVPDLADCWF